MLYIFVIEAIMFALGLVGTIAALPGLRRSRTPRRLTLGLAAPSPAPAAVEAGEAR